MRGCILSLILILLLAANGYVIWQVHVMRGEIAGLREELARQRGEVHMSMLDYARDAAEAIGRGEIARARADLERVSQMARETREMAEERRRQLAEQVRAAEQAVSRGGEAARERIDALVRFLSPKRPEEEPASR
jgi:multidrug resistance efflux pump